MSSKGQAAMEFLMTYGWAILVVLAAISALAYFGVLSPDKFLSSKCIAEAPFSCNEYYVSGTEVNISLQNNIGSDLESMQVTLTCPDGTVAGPLPATPTFLGDGAEIMLQFSCGTATAAGERFKGNYSIDYLQSGTTTPHTSSGSLAVRAE